MTKNKCGLPHHHGNDEAEKLGNKIIPAAVLVKACRPEHHIENRIYAKINKKADYTYHAELGDLYH